eukprot:TRINITY_DN39601_c0_g1_i1.p1 TRINITY_DN39601_c0_g1~~TRINITY_DN39601_c0_g1_i1.p1  ORF type:complete len:220 (+),score=66.54 TRINITY_DN39601_c0_g1_i1:95-754(+)
MPPLLGAAVPAALLLLLAGPAAAVTDEEELLAAERRLQEVRERLRKARDKRTKATAMRAATHAAARTGPGATQYNASAAQARRDQQKRLQPLPAGWTRLEGDCPGSNLEKLHGIKAAECAAACDKQTACAGFSFIQGPAEASDSTFCWLKSIKGCSMVVKTGWMFYVRGADAAARRLANAALQPSPPVPAAPQPRPARASAKETAKALLRQEAEDPEEE